MSIPRKYECPYCERMSVSPAGVRFHVGSEHPDKVEDFQNEHYPAMKEAYNK